MVNGIVVLYFHLDESAGQLCPELLASNFLNFYQMAYLLHHAANCRLVRAQHRVVHPSQTERADGSFLIGWPADRASDQCDPQLAASGSLSVTHH
jgi:hypothetical protein